MNAQQIGTSSQLTYTSNVFPLSSGPQHGNGRNAGNMHRGQGHNARAGEGALHLENGAQQEYRQSPGKNVQRHANNELVRMKLDHKQIVEKPQNHTHSQRQQYARQPALAKVAAQHGKERADQHHAVDTNIGNVHMLGHQATQGRQHHGRSRAQGVLQKQHVKNLSHVRPPPSGGRAAGPPGR